MAGLIVTLHNCNYYVLGNYKQISSSIVGKNPHLSSREVGAYKKSLSININRKEMDLFT
jgi:hypothetical protein